MTYVDVLVRLLNEMLDDQPASNRKVVEKALTQPHPGWVGFFTGKFPLPDDLIISSTEGGVVRLSMLGILNTALERAGDDRKIIATTDDDGGLQHVTLGPYPKVKKK